MESVALSVSPATWTPESSALESLPAKPRQWVLAVERVYVQFSVREPSPPRQLHRYSTARIIPQTAEMTNIAFGCADLVLDDEILISHWKSFLEELRILGLSMGLLHAHDRGRGT